MMGKGVLMVLGRLEEVDLRAVIGIEIGVSGLVIRVSL